MFTPKEAGEKLFVGAATVRNYIRNGVGKDKERLRAIKIMHGRRIEYRIAQSDLEYYKLKYLTVKEVIKP